MRVLNAVCTQELIQQAHEQDTDDSYTSSVSIPLLFYDWRGEERAEKPIKAPAAAKSVEEIHNWFSYYLLGKDFDEDQATALKVTNASALWGAFVDGKLTYEYSELVRQRFGEAVLPAISYLLENFLPYRRYITELRTVENDCLDSGDVGAYALSMLRFGFSLSPDAIRPGVDAKLHDVIQRIEEIKVEKLDELLREDIGMRGIVYAFGSLFRAIRPNNWLEYAVWFTDAVNMAVEGGWLTKRGTVAARHLHQIAMDQNGSIINYRLEHAGSSLGAYVEMLVFSYANLRKWEVDWDQIRDDTLTRLRGTLLRGYKKEVRLELKEYDEFKEGGTPLTEAVRKEAEKRVRVHMRRLENALSKTVD